MTSNHRVRTALAAGAAFFFFTSSLAFAHENEGRGVIAPPGQVNRPAPIVVNPNGMPPVGHPLSHPDLDRGRSEGKGHNDVRHANNAARTVRGTISSLGARTITVLTPSGLQTFRISEGTYDKLTARPRSNVVLITKNGSVVSVR